MKFPKIRSVALFTLFGLSGVAEDLTVFFGTGGRGSEGIYKTTFNTSTGKFGTIDLAAESQSPGFLALHPDGDKLYAVERWDNDAGAAGYRIEEDGSLTLVNRVSSGDGPGAHLAVHPTGKFLITAQYGGGSVALFPINTEGQLGIPKLYEHEGSSGVVERRQKAPHPHWTGFSPDGRFALVPDLGKDGIVIYRVDAETPSLVPHGFAASVPGGGARHMRFSPNGEYIYLLNELTLDVSTFKWNGDTGTATLLTTTPTLTEAAKSAESFNSAAEILVHPDLPTLYTSNRGHDSVSVFQIGSNPEDLEVVQVQPVRGAFPRNINLDPSGSWLLAAGADSNTVSAHRIDSESGKLTYQRRSVINVPNPICILFVPGKNAPPKG
ncbi:MAG: lactonase family protein [Verrucomicrobiota bacterium]